LGFGGTDEAQQEKANPRKKEATTMTAKDMQIQSGIVQRPPIIVMHGVVGVGKSTFASESPKPIFADVEDRTAHLNIHRLPKPGQYQYEDLLEQIDWLTTAKHDYQTFVIDGFDRLELVVHEYLTRTRATDKGKKVSHIQDYGYGKGFEYAEQVWADLLDRLKTLRAKRSMTIILLGHSLQKDEEDVVRGEKYKRLKIKLQDRVKAIVENESDCILFATHEVLITKDKQDKAVPLSEGKSIMYTEYRPQWDAKNCLGLPFQLPLDWPSFDDAMKKGQPNSPEALRQSIEGLLSRVDNQEVREKATKAFQDAGNDAKRLNIIKNRLVTIVEQRKE
jgi:hypothetical protein